MLSAVPTDSLDEQLQLINSLNENIQFTSEVEENCTINYLDLHIIKSSDGFLSFKIHRKATHTNKYLDYSSYHPNSHKDSVANTLLHRAHNICDD